MRKVHHTLGCRKRAGRLRPGPPRLLSGRSMAVELGMSEGTVRNRVREGVLVPDYQTQKESLFVPDRLDEMRSALMAHPVVIA